MMRSFLKKININILYIILIFFTSFFYFEFIKSPNFSSEMIIALKEDDDKPASPNFNFDLTSSSFSSSGSDLYKVKDLLESKNMIQYKINLIESIGYDKIFSKNPFDIVYLTNSVEDIVDKSQIIKINELSNTISFTSIANTKQGAFILNLLNLIVLSDYFDLSKRLDSEFNVARSLCKLDINSLELTDLSSVDITSETNLEEVLSSKSGIGLISKRIENQKKRCISNLNINQNSEVKDQKINIPRNNLDQIVLKSKNDSTNEIIGDLISKNFISDRIEIVSDASKPIKKDDARSIISSLIIIFVFFILRFFYRITSRLINYS